VCYTTFEYEEEIGALGYCGTPVWDHHALCGVCPNTDCWTSWSVGVIVIIGDPQKVHTVISSTTQGLHIFQISRSHFHIPDTRRVTWSKFY